VNSRWLTTINKTIQIIKGLDKHMTYKNVR